MMDITSQKQAEARLRHLADHDHLTGLLNRRRFEERVDERIAAEPRTGGAIAVLDIDRMKLLNDALGHAAGDAVLVEIAGSLEDMLSPGQLLARLSSDEFALYMPGLDEAEAERLVAALGGYIRRRQARLALTASAGIAMIRGVRSAADLIVAADVALYEAKEAGPRPGDLLGRPRGSTRRVGDEGAGGRRTGAPRRLRTADRRSRHRRAAGGGAARADAR